MNEPFILPVSYKGEALEFKARFERWGYTHRIAVLVDEHTYVFEPDEEGGYRALTDPAKLPTNVDTGLLNAVAVTLVELGQLS